MILTADCLVCTQRIALESARFITRDEIALKDVVFYAYRREDSNQPAGLVRDESEAVFRVKQEAHPSIW